MGAADDLGPQRRRFLRWLPPAVGVAISVVLVAAAALLLQVTSEPPVDGAPSPTPQARPLQETPTPDDEPLARLDFADLEELFPDSVGPYRRGPLLDTAIAMEQGAVDSATATYTDDDEAVNLVASLFPDDAAAGAHLQQVVDRQTDDDSWTLVHDTPLQDHDDRQAGRYVVMEDVSGGRAVGWANRNAVFRITAADGQPDVEAFYEDLPY